MFSCCGNAQPVVADDVAVQIDKPSVSAPAASEAASEPAALAAPEKQAPKLEKAPKPEKENKDPAPAPAEKPAAPLADAAVQRIETRFTRSTPQTPWGVDLTSDSEHSLSIVRIAPEGALATSNQKSRDPVKPGDVLVAIGGAKAKMEMVAKLKTEVDVSVEVVRCSEFDAVLTKKSASEPLSMDVNDAGSKQLLIQKIAPVGSAVTRYNEKQYEKPVIEGDHIIAVNGKTTVAEMVKEMQSNLTITCRVKRGWA